MHAAKVLMTMLRRFPVLLVVLLAPPGTAPNALGWESVEAGALETKLLRDAGDGRLDDFSLFDAALIASGLRDGDAVSERDAKLHRLLAELSTACAQTAEKDRVARVFRFMHERMLTGNYDARCSNFRTTLDEGRFNCVTATLLFQVLCEHVSLHPEIVAVPGHVFSRFAAPEIGDVQTTCAEWFGNPHSIAPWPPGASVSADQRRVINPVQLLGKIYYNEGVSLLELDRFSEAIHMLQTSLQLDPHDSAAHDNLLAGWNNWALAEEDAGHMERAADLVRQGLLADPTYAPLLANDLHIHQKWALELCDAERYEEAMGLLQRCHARRPDVPLFDLGRLAVVAVWSETLLKQGQFDAAFRVLDDAHEALSRRGELDGYEEKLVCKTVDSLRRSGRQQQAVTLSLLGLERQPSSERLRRQYRDLTE